MTIEYLLSRYKSIYQDLGRAVSEDDYRQLQNLDNQMTETLNQLFDVRPNGSADRDILFMFFLRLLNPDPEKDSLMERVENKLIELSKL